MVFKIKFTILLFCVTTIFVSCKKNKADVIGNTSLYFPATNSTNWETIDAATLGWNAAELNNLYPYLQSKNTKAFIILKNGKMVCEKYFDTFTRDSNWYWASAGKTLTGFLVGIAQKEGIVNINQKTSKYLGTGWSSAPLQKENLITVKNQLTMTTGLNDETNTKSCTDPICLTYLADAGTRWAYYNAPYTVLDKVIENASGKTYNSYFQQKIRDKIGMNGVWIKNTEGDNVYYSTPRSMAKFGLLLLNKGIWDGNPILDDPEYFKNQTNTSQNLNLSYGYLTWLNGKESCMVPTLRTVFPNSLIPNGPSDMFAALGKNDQKIYVVPSQNLVVIRMGNSASESLQAVTAFDNELWGKLKTIIKF